MEREYSRPVMGQPRQLRPLGRGFLVYFLFLVESLVELVIIRLIIEGTRYDKA